MYQLPLKFVKISDQVAICATRIVALMSTKAYQARETIKSERKNGTLINGCGTRSAETVVFLDNGTVIASPYTVQTLLSAIERANNRDPYSKRTNETIRMKVYNVVDDDVENVNCIEEREFEDEYIESESDDVETD